MLIMLYFNKLTGSLNELNMPCYLITIRIALISANLTRKASERRASTVSVLCKVQLELALQWAWSKFSRALRAIQSSLDPQAALLN